ncbi:MAG: (2Fe-2S)-binding protein [Gemmatimonadetes bacterium]|nr:(2Fe-2S)-binding protein [Gemmatimonadota bacterium]
MRLTINGVPRDVPAGDHETLLAVIRERLQLTGTKEGCARGECGACTVLIDGRAAYSCLTLAAGCADSAVTTIEGLGRADALHPLQQAFIEQDALQCGFCTPGQLLAAAALIARTPRPSEDDVRVALSGNLCRCGTYPKLVRAVMQAAEMMRAEP